MGSAREHLPAVRRPAAEVVVWVHGGAYVGGSLRMAESHAVAMDLARTGRPVVAVDYRKVSMLPLLPPKRPIRRHRNNFPVPGIDASAVKRQFTAETYRRITLNFVGDPAVLEDLAACPATASADGVPPTLFIDADWDTLRASSELYAKRLETEGVPVSSMVVRGSAHGFLNKPRAGHHREGTTVMAAWLDELSDRCDQRR